MINHTFLFPHVVPSAGITRLRLDPPVEHHNPVHMSSNVLLYIFCNYNVSDAFIQFILLT
jgi:hypothetical protein